MVQSDKNQVESWSEAPVIYYDISNARLRACTVQRPVIDVLIMLWSAELNKAFKLNISISTSCVSQNSLVRMNTVKLCFSCFTLSTLFSALKSLPSGALQRRWGNQLVVEVPFNHLPQQKYSDHKVRVLSAIYH